MEFSKVISDSKRSFFLFRSDNFSHPFAPKTLCHGTFVLEWVVSVLFIYGYVRPFLPMFA